MISKVILLEVFQSHGKGNKLTLRTRGHEHKLFTELYDTSVIR